VHDHQAPVTGALNIQFDEINSQSNTSADGGDCVLRGVTRGSPMANSENPLGDPQGQGSEYMGVFQSCRFLQNRPKTPREVSCCRQSDIAICLLIHPRIKVTISAADFFGNPGYTLAP
jgi:hypothetical protein